MMGSVISSWVQFIIAVWLVSIIILAWFWCRNLGYARGVGAAICRLLWTLPLVLSLSPENSTKRISGTVALQPINILVDDSDSMDLADPVSSLSAKGTKSTLKQIDEVCIQFGCLPKVTKLSDLAPETKLGFTPLSRVIEPWLYKTGGEPWMLLSDGGDFRPTLNWPDRIKSRSRPQKSLGLVVAYGKPRTPGIAVASVSLAPLAFEGKTVQVAALMTRVVDPSVIVSSMRAQVQATVDGQVVATTEADFNDSSSQTSVNMTFPAPKRGPHIVAVKALPVAGELDLWDNVQTRVLEVMPNTVGALHLLGSPAWDGRFMRRFLKAEPKFDVISFFILRDPWDSQLVSERELSLIPFPVERLFNEELVNFKVIILQNFTLMRFLQSEYQANLAKFVKDGGGLLFIGGPRALTEIDVTSSSLSGLLPFDLDKRILQNDSGSSWDRDKEFKVEMAAPDAAHRALATVFESWQVMSDRLGAVKTMKGIHRMDAIKFHDRDVTPLLTARFKDGTSAPLAVASYPGKGRALWIFSDSFWRLAMSSNPLNARSDYHQFIDQALTWLTRGEMKGSLDVREFKLLPSSEATDRLKWHVVLFGPAAKYLKSATASTFSICGITVPPESVVEGNATGDIIEFEGELHATMQEGSLCQLKYDVEHPSFGALHVGGWSLIPETIPDKNVGPAPEKLRQLAALTGATFVEADAQRGKAIELWLEAWGSAKGHALPDKIKSTRNFYWPLDSFWMWFLLMALPGEVICRRWHMIFGRDFGAMVRGRK